jgi:hypothetical protein
MRVALFLLALLCGAPAPAGQVASYSTRDAGLLAIEVDDRGRSRVGPVNARGDYLLIVDGESYLVLDQGRAAVRAGDLLAHHAEQQAMVTRLLSGFPRPNEGDASPSFSKGGQRTVGGVVGIEYHVSNLSPRLPYGTNRWVVSAEPWFEPAGQAFAAYVRFGLQALRPLFGAREPNSLSFVEELLALGAPLSARHFELQSVAIKPVDPERLELPARLVTGDELKAMGK